MIIENRWFAIQGPRRVDLSGHPWGVLFLWFGGHGRVDSGRFQRLPHTKEFGFFIPYTPARFRNRKYEPLEVSQLIDQVDPIPHDCREWPAGYRDAADAAVARAVAARPGSKIVFDWSRCDRRIDLGARPQQLYRVVLLERAA